MATFLVSEAGRIRCQMHGTKLTLLEETSYSLVHQDNAADIPTQQEFKTLLEKGNDEQKIETMKRIL